jgi:hypothetical protein
MHYDCWSLYSPSVTRTGIFFDNNTTLLTKDLKVQKIISRDAVGLQQSHNLILVFAFNYFLFELNPAAEIGPTYLSTSK